MCLVERFLKEKKVFNSNARDLSDSLKVFLVNAIPRSDFHLEFGIKLVVEGPNIMQDITPKIVMNPSRDCEVFVCQEDWLVQAGIVDGMWTTIFDAFAKLER